MDVKKILFITGTRADYGKIKSLIKEVENSDKFEAYIYVSGMHLLDTFGSTYKEILKDNYKNTYVAFGLVNSHSMSYNLGDVVCNLTGYIMNIKPDLVVVHGDRIDALAGAIVGALNNIRVAHIEGGELSGTIDESIRHSISKLAHIHLVSNEEAKKRLIQLGENKETVHVIGSPDIDIMMSPSLPTISKVKQRYEIPFDKYGILMYHPVTTEYEEIGQKIKAVVDAVIQSNKNFVVVYPNCDLGSEIILNEYKRLNKNNHFKLFPSLRFEYFLTLLKNSEFMIGNSSAGIRETSIYGIPSIDIGTRQSGRYKISTPTNIQHVDEKLEDILEAINNIQKFRIKNMFFGEGNSTKLFMKIMEDENLWKQPIQKRFIDMEIQV